MEYKGYNIEPNLTGYAPKHSTYHFYIYSEKVDGKETYNFNEINSWRKAINNRKLSCNIDCSEAEYGNCHYPNDCQKRYLTPNQ